MTAPNISIIISATTSVYNLSGLSVTIHNNDAKEDFKLHKYKHQTLTSGCCGRGFWNVTGPDGKEVRYSGPMKKRRKPDHNDPTQWTVIPPSTELTLNCNISGFYSAPSGSQVNFTMHGIASNTVTLN